MASPKGRAGDKAGFTTPAPGRHGRDFGSLRTTAMQAARLLREMLPPPQKQQKSKKKKKTKDSQAERPSFGLLGVEPVVSEGGEPKQSDSVPAAPQPLPPGFDRLLGGNDGIIDGLAKLTQLVIRLSDKERESLDAVQAAKRSAPKIDEQALDRRIADELARIAARRGAAGIYPPDRPDPG